MYDDDYYSDVENLEGDLIGRGLIKLRLKRQLRTETDINKRKAIRGLLKDLNNDIFLIQNEINIIG